MRVGRGAAREFAAPAAAARVCARAGALPAAAAPERAREPHGRHEPRRSARAEPLPEAGGRDVAGLCGGNASRWRRLLPNRLDSSDGDCAAGDASGARRHEAACRLARSASAERTAPVANQTARVNAAARVARGTAQSAIIYDLR